MGTGPPRPRRLSERLLFPGGSGGQSPRLPPAEGGIGEVSFLDVLVPLISKRAPSFGLILAASVNAVKHAGFTNLFLLPPCS